MRCRAAVGWAVLACGVGLVVGCGRAVVPDQYTQYKASDSSFCCDAPAGWEVTGGGKNGNYNATFSSGGAEISVTMDVVGSILFGGTPPSVAGGAPNLGELSPLAMAHARSGEQFAEALNGFQDLDTVEFRMEIGEGRKSEFTGKGTLGKAQHGYRVTALLSEQQMRICCQCSEEEWADLQPVFDRVINSMTWVR